MDFNFVTEIKDQYPEMSIEQRAEWFDNMLEKLGMSKYFDASNDKDYNEAQLERLLALRKSTALFKDVFVNGISPENKHKLADSQRIWKEYNLDKGLEFTKDETVI